MPQASLEFPPDYPARPPFFGFIVSKLAIKTCLITEIGADAYALLMLVAMTEDSARYRHPAWLWNKQARDYLGCCTDTLIATRKRLIDSGWLYYRARGRKKAPEYWVVVPDGIGDEERNDLGERLNQYASLRSVDFIDSSSIDRRSIVDSSSIDRRLNVEPFLPLPLSKKTSALPLAKGGGGFSETSRSLARDHSSAPDVETSDAQPEPSCQRPQLDSSGDQRRSAGNSTDARDHSEAPPVETRDAQPPLTRSASRSEIVRRLRVAGVSLAEPTLDQALALGLTERAISDVLDHVEARPGWWGGGAIFRRLNCPNSGPLPADQGWAKPDASAVARWTSLQHRDRSAAALVALTARPPAEPSIAVQQTWDWVALEAAYGATIDAAPLEQLAAMLATDFARKMLRRDKGRQSLSVRRELLRAFAAAAI